MKKIAILSAAAAAGLFVSATAYAQQTITSIQFTSGTDLAPTDQAGVTGSSNWNTVNTGTYIVYNTPSQTGNPNAPAPITETASTGLITSTGAPSTVGYSITSGGGLYGGNSNALTGPDHVLLNGGGATGGAMGTTSTIYGAPVTLTLNNLNPTSTYSFIAYISGSDYELSQSSVSSTVGGTQYFTSASGGFAAGYLSQYQSVTSSSQIAGGAGTAASYQSNYVEFDGITGVSSDTLTLTFLGGYPNGVFTPAGTTDPYGAGGNGQIALAGVQIFETAAVPEPSTYVLIGLGLCALVVMRRRAAKV